MIKEYRQKNGFSQEELAEKIDISWRHLQRLEHNESKTTVKTLKKLIKVLKISDKDILDYLKNNTENELITFNEKGIKNKEKISFVFDGVKYSIKINDNDILLVRDGNDFINSFSFNEKHGKSNYYLKEHGYSVDIDINMKMFDVNDNKIYIKYVIADTECEYELLIEMGDIL